MVRVFVDPHMFSVKWFQEALTELVRSKKVMFLFANCERGLTEVQKVRQARAFKKAMKSARKSVEADQQVVEGHVVILEAHPRFAACGDCNDPHIMAAIYVHPTAFVFTEDHGLARCRDALSGRINRRYLAFSVVSDAGVYAGIRARLV